MFTCFQAPWKRPRPCFRVALLSFRSCAPELLCAVERNAQNINSWRLIFTRSEARKVLQLFGYRSKFSAVIITYQFFTSAAFTSEKRRLLFLCLSSIRLEASYLVRSVMKREKLRVKYLKLTITSIALRAFWDGEASGFTDFVEFLCVNLRAILHLGHLPGRKHDYEPAIHGVRASSR